MGEKIFNFILIIFALFILFIILYIILNLIVDSIKKIRKETSKYKLYIFILLLLVGLIIIFCFFYYFLDWLYLRNYISHLKVVISIFIFIAFLYAIILFRENIYGIPKRYIDKYKFFVLVGGGITIQLLNIYYFFNISRNLEYLNTEPFAPLSNSILLIFIMMFFNILTPFFLFGIIILNFKKIVSTFTNGLDINGLELKLTKAGKFNVFSIETLHFYNIIFEESHYKIVGGYFSSKINIEEENLEKIIIEQSPKKLKQFLLGDKLKFDATEVFLRSFTIMYEHQYEKFEITYLYLELFEEFCKKNNIDFQYIHNYKK